MPSIALHRPSRRPALRPLAFAMAAGSLLSLPPSHVQAQAQALPSGLQVVQGSASVRTSGSTMTVTNSTNAILQWQGFSIGAGQTVHFQQPSAASAVLNRVTGTDPSLLLGTLSSNGRVWLLNPNGVIFGSGARVDVAGLVASTLNLADADWLAGRYRLSAPAASSAVGVQQQGEIRTASGGRVLLVSESGVTNDGTIDAPGGQVALVSARQLEVADSTAPHVVLAVGDPAGQVLNRGTLQAPGGRIDVQAAVVNQQGLVSAGSIGMGPAGEVLLRASESLQADAGSRTRADGAAGGRVVIDGGSGRTLVAGTVSATGTAGRGGDVRLLGREVGLAGAAQVDVSGRDGGGQVLAGGGVQGRDATVPNAHATFMSADARISADATGAGDGGRIVLWGDAVTRAYGTLTARGGTQGGDGGFIETSGGTLDARPAFVSAAAPAGRAGRWLLDPNDILVSDTVPDAQVTGGPDFGTLGDAATISTATIAAALEGGSNVTITTGTAAPGAGAGDVLFDRASLLVSLSSPVSLTVDAHRDIRFESSFFSASGPLTLQLNAGRGGSGDVSFVGSSIGTGGGDIGIVASRLTVDSSSLMADGGRVSLRADEQRFLNASGIFTFGSGDMIVAQGRTGGFARVFDNSSGGSLFNLDGGRWLVHVDTPAAFNAGMLDYGFVQYGSGPLSDVSNNGVVYQLAPVLSLNGTATKVYDGSTEILLSGLGIAGGALAGDTVTLSDADTLSAQFADAHAGTGKTYTLDPGAIFATDAAGRAVYGYTATGTGTITPRPLNLMSAVATGKTYDGTADASFGALVLSGLVAGDSLVATGTGRFDSRNVGTGRLATLESVTLADGAGRASDYTLQSVSGFTSRADITPRPLAVSGGALNKVYDGSTTATMSLMLAGVVTGDSVSLSAGPANFADANVGTGKTVDLTLGLVGDDAANYTLLATGFRASITPATLRYVATPVQVPVGGAWPAFTGTVEGFVGGDTLAGATSGSLAFTPGTTAATVPGRYAILGGGLSAANYVFEQDAGNAHALTVAGGSTAVADETPVRLASATQSVQPAAPQAAPGAVPSVLDAMSATRPADGDGVVFPSLPVSSMEERELARALAAREQYKKAVFAASLEALARDPSLADLPGCQTVEQAESGRCLVTESFKQRVQSAGAGGAVTALDPATGPAGTSSTPAAAPVAAPAAAAAATAVPTPSVGWQARRVRSASLPQIQRKVALVLGVDRYADRRIPQLQNAVNDARAVARTLEESLGYDTVVLENPGKPALVAALNRLALSARPQDSVVVYYAGHGDVEPNTGQGYWQLADAQSTNPRSWLSNGDIGRLLRAIGASQVALVSDSCYSGTLVGAERIRGSDALNPDEVLGRKAAVVLTSGGNEPVSDEGRHGHSPFAWNLMQSWRQVAAWQAGGSLAERVRFAVARQLPQRPRYGAAAEGGHQSGADYLFERRELDR